MVYKCGAIQRHHWNFFIKCCYLLIAAPGILNIDYSRFCCFVFAWLDLVWIIAIILQKLPHLWIAVVFWHRI